MLTQSRTNMQIAQKLRDTIEDHDDTQTALAESLGVTRRQVVRWVSGEQEMGIYKLREICIKYQISADYLLNLPKGMKWPK